MTLAQAPSEQDEKSRLASLDRYGILDTPGEEGFDDIVLLATQLCSTPVALVTLVSGGRQWFKARIGFDPCETPLSQSVCSHALWRPGLLIIPDLTLDPRTSDNTLVTGSPHIRFYAGARLEAPDGLAIGTLCVIDTEPRPEGLTPAQAHALEALARQVMVQLELRRGNVARDRAIKEKEAYEDQLRGLNAQLELEIKDRTLERDRVWKHSRDLQVELGNDGTITAANDAWTTMLGWLLDDVIGHDHLEFTHEDHRTNGTDALDRGFRGAFEPYETRFLCKDGSVKWLSWVAEPHGAFVYASGRDITVEKAAATALAASMADRARIWRLSTEIMLVADFEATITAVNPAWTQILGWQPGELIGRKFMELIHPDDVVATLAEVGKLSEGATTFKFENRYQCKDSSYRAISWTAVPDERFIHAVGRDVTDERAQQAELVVFQEALRQSQKMEAVGQLTGGLAHDFNNLLTVITGSLELIERSLLKGKITETERFLNAGQTAAKRAAALTHRLLAFSRRQTLDPKPTAVNRLISGMNDLIVRTMGPEITIEIVGAGGLWNTLVDPNQLENALLNLCINARDAMPDGGRLTVETGNRWFDERTAKERDVPSGQYVSLCVSDTGTGMPADVIAKAFEPFFTTKPIGQGTGLGLSMIYGFARQSGGQARIYSEVGQGTRVCLYIPRHLGEDTDSLIMAPAAPTRAEDGQTVLVVDDEPAIRMLVVEVLEDLGYCAIEAGDGPSAMEIIQSNVRIDLLVTDVGMPGGMNGRQLADASRMIRAELKILFITGYAENAAVGNGHLEHGMAVMTKPFAVDALANRIKELISN